MKSTHDTQRNTRTPAASIPSYDRSPLTAILGSPADPEHFTETQIDRLRRYAVAAAPNLPFKELEAFIIDPAPTKLNQAA